jgi:hypothetical protein
MKNINKKEGHHTGSADLFLQHIELGLNRAQNQSTKGLFSTNIRILKAVASSAKPAFVLESFEAVLHRGCLTLKQHLLDICSSALADGKRPNNYEGGGKKYLFIFGTLKQLIN